MNEEDQRAFSHSHSIDMVDTTCHLRWKGGVVASLQYDSKTRGSSVLQQATTIMKTLKTLKAGEHVVLECFGTRIYEEDMVSNLISSRWKEMCSKLDIEAHADVWVDMFTENPEKEKQDRKREDQAFRDGQTGGIAIVVNQFFDPQRSTFYADLNDSVEDLLYQIQKILKHNVKETYLTLGPQRELDPQKTLSQEKFVDGCHVWIHRKFRR
jgi:hypothetical protein